ncbi:TfoX/Sxy family protein [Actinophytocola sp.]|uniref:TfoX/Sxy family protein n=1 Tax=Actinophytocola sp. TaxID=1872138 RepID=UPI002D80858F|nr:TfoX/Sxy family protein [Actinophytocola sp.]HET9140430.1 TfoX/Sxy family protein [Actinophytocola sp.]
MAYDEALAERVRERIEGGAAVAEQKMFGGLAFLERGHIVVGIMGDDLLVRVGAAGKAAALRRPGVREFDFTGRPMRAFVVVAGEVLDDAVLDDWLAAGRTFAASLPAK